VELTIKKTVGQPSRTQAGAKDYMITLSNGQSYLAEKSGSNKYICNGVKDTLKGIKKMLVSSDGMWDNEEEITESLVPASSEGKTWRTDAAALLALMTYEKTRDDVSIHWIKDCLDKHGYLRPNGEIDTHAAKIQIEALYVQDVWKTVEEMENQGF